MLITNSSQDPHDLTPAAVLRFILHLAKSIVHTQILSPPLPSHVILGKLLNFLYH